MKYQSSINRRFSLIAGNPPYIKKGLLKKAQIRICEEIHQSASLPNTTVKNIWSAFLIRCSQLLFEDGVLAFVLPAELLQVNFSDALRNYLIKVFERIEIFTFSELMFDCKGQDTVLLFGFKKHQNPGQYYTHITNSTQLNKFDFVLKQNGALLENDVKWTHHILSEDELSFIYKLASKLNTINHYCDSKPGIVTAANNFFIINENIKQQYKLDQYCRPIIQKALYVNGSVVFDKNDFEELIQEGMSTNVLCFSDSMASNLSTGVKDYIAMGETKDLHKGYKCSKRTNWFVIPNIATVPEAFFFRRTHLYPKLIKNEANVLVTDSAYKVQMRKGYSINGLIVGFYNSLTLIFSEIFGRYYGGGLLELTPKEFKKIPVIETAISEAEFGIFVEQFEQKKSIKDVLELNDIRLLYNKLHLSLEEISVVRSIYKKLIEKRFRRL